MYFEDIYNRIRPFWKKTYINVDYDKDLTFEEDYIGYDWHQIDFILNTNKEKYDVWDSMMLFIMLQVIVEYSKIQFKLGKQIIDIDEISISRFEKRYLENLRYEGNEKYLKKYKGLKTSY